MVVLKGKKSWSFTEICAKEFTVKMCVMYNIDTIAVP